MAASNNQDNVEAPATKVPPAKANEYMAYVLRARAAQKAEALAELAAKADACKELKVVTQYGTTNLGGGWEEVEKSELAGMSAQVEREKLAKDEKNSSRWFGWGR